MLTECLNEDNLDGNFLTKVKIYHNYWIKLRVKFTNYLIKMKIQKITEIKSILQKEN